MSQKDGRIRKNINAGTPVQIILKQDQSNGRLTKGIVEELLTNAAKHPHGIKVRLRSGEIGRVAKVLSSKKRSGPAQPPAPKFEKKAVMPWEQEF